MFSFLAKETVYVNFIFFYIIFFIPKLNCFQTDFIIFKFKFSFYDTLFLFFFCFVFVFCFFNFHYCHLLSNPSNIVMIFPPKSSFIKSNYFFVFSFRQWFVSFISWSIKFSFNIFCNVFMNIICFYVCHETM